MKKTILVLFVILSACATYKPYYKNGRSVTDSGSDQPTRSIFLLSGASQTKDNSSPALMLLKSQLSQAGETGSLFLMGNNGTKEGLPDSTHVAKRRAAEDILFHKLNMLKGFDGDIVITPGFQDWASGGKRGYKNVLNLEEYVESILDNKGNVFLPDNGCPGPHEVNLSEDLVAIVIDTQWWLHEWEKPGEGSGCESSDAGSFLVHLKAALMRNSDKKVIVVGSHPLYSNGPHGGYFPASTHLLPPVIGTLYAGYRKHVGNLQDISTAKYRKMSEGLTEMFKLHPNLIYVSGHEKSLQHHTVNNQHYIISGAAAAVKPVVKGKTAEFAYAKSGFGKLNFYDNGDVFLEFWVANGQEGEMAYRQKLFNHAFKLTPEENYENLDFSELTEKGVADASLAKKKKRPGMLGNNYRKEWAAELEAPVFDIGKEHGGLKIVQRGGGMQTRSLRMEDSKGKQYVIRSVEKFPEAAVPAVFRKTIIGDLVKDQLSASHPYAALVVAPMADAAGVYHTNPKLVYVKDDPRLGIYNDDFKNGFYIYEERPAKDRSDVASLGYSKKIINTFDVLDKTQKNDDAYVDQMHVVRSRIFDIFLGDWDRHDDQWRWASFKDEDKQTYYQPIPRDRDQAFFYGDGSVLKFASHKWGNPKTQGFHHDIRDVSGLEFNARHFDRSFMTAPTEQDWIDLSRELQASLTDEIIANAIKGFPKPIYALNGETIISKLKSRRDKLEQYAKEHYAFLAKSVDVVGTNKRELFEVMRMNDQETQVKVSSVNKKGEVQHVLYDRVFKSIETKEVRLYGLKGDDIFNISGDTRKGVKVRIIGGKGEDNIEDKTTDKGGNKVIVYDTDGKNSLIGAGIKDKTSDDPDINYYDRKEFQYDKVFPLAKISSNPDDGFIFGGGFVFTKNKFRKVPFGSVHKVAFDFAPKTSAFNLIYLAHYTDAVGKWDYLMAFDIHEPSFSDLFYGLGNKSFSDETLRESDTQYYLAKYSQITFKNSLAMHFDEDKQSFGFGGCFNSVNITRDDNTDEGADRFISLYPNQVDRGASSTSPLLDKRRNYLGAEFDYSWDNTDSKLKPTRGFRVNLDGKVSSQLGDESNVYEQISSDVSMYLSTGGTFNTTLAARIGGAANFGDFEFYQAVRLGGTTNNRGYRKFRFSGDESVYQNTELRIKLFNFRTSLFPGSIGLIAFHDVGRIWSDNSDNAFTDNSLEDWHRGYGGGIWISPLDKLALSIESAQSNDEDNKLLFIRLGFMF